MRTVVIWPRASVYENSGDMAKSAVHGNRGEKAQSFFV